MHILPQLRKLERKYRDFLVVIGVHSSKFPNEKETDNVRSAILRYGIEHPVINDRDFALWQRYGVRAWPTLMFVDPEGRVIGKHEGEFDISQFDELVGDMGLQFDRDGRLNKKPLPYQLEAERAIERPLSFPGKIEADETTGRLFIADSGHNRVLITDLTGLVLDIIGSGEAGSADGSLDSASFNHPQGMAVDDHSVYVADAENHNIRLIDLAERTVSTIAGTGEQALYRHKGGDLLQHPLNSPYDLALEGGRLFIAMAGFHQLWMLDLAGNEIAPYAGDGAEDIADGPRLSAKLAQPYGIVTDGNRLYFADSETSSIRSVGFGDDAAVETLVGTGLFDFGDRDGPFSKAILQHVQAVAVGNKRKLYAADTYNHKIKMLDLTQRTINTLAGTGQRGIEDGPVASASFNEPAGIAILGNRLYVADTNNHAIRVIDLAEETVATLEIRGL